MSIVLIVPEPPGVYKERFHAGTVSTGVLGARSRGGAGSGGKALGGGVSGRAAAASVIFNLLKVFVKIRAYDFKIGS